MNIQEVSRYGIRESLKSPCQSKRGAVIWANDRIISVGYNHQPEPFACDGSARCKSTCGRTAVHAEQHAIVRAGLEIGGAQMLHVKTVNGALVASGEPSCLECSKLILASGITFMWLYESIGWVRYNADAFHRLSAERHGIQLIGGAL